MTAKHRALKPKTDAEKRANVRTVLANAMAKSSLKLKKSKKTPVIPGQYH